MSGPKDIAAIGAVDNGAPGNDDDVDIIGNVSTETKETLDIIWNILKRKTTAYHKRDLSDSIRKAVRERLVLVASERFGDNGHYMIGYEAVPVEKILAGDTDEVTKDFLRSPVSNKHTRVIVQYPSTKNSRVFSHDYTREDAMIAAAHILDVDLIKLCDEPEDKLPSKQGDEPSRLLDIAWFKKNKSRNFYARPHRDGEKVDLDLRGVFYDQYVLVVYGVGNGKLFRFWITKPSPEEMDNPWVRSNGSKPRWYKASDVIAAIRTRRFGDPGGLFDGIKPRDAEHWQWTADHPDRYLVSGYKNSVSHCDLIGTDPMDVRNTCYDNHAMGSDLLLSSNIGNVGNDRAANMARYVIRFALWGQRDFPVYRPTKAAIEQALDPHLLPDDQLPVAFPYASMFVDLRALRPVFMPDEMIGTGVVPIYAAFLRLREDKAYRFNPLGRLSDLGLSHLGMGDPIRPQDREIIDRCCDSRVMHGMLVMSDGSLQAPWSCPEPKEWSQWRVYASWLREKDRYVEGQLNALLSGLFYNLAKIPPAIVGPKEKREIKVVKPPLALERIREIHLDRNTAIAVDDGTVARPVINPRGPLDTSRLRLVMTTVREHNRRYYVGSGTDKKLEPRLVEEKQAHRWMSEETILTNMFDGVDPS